MDSTKTKICHISTVHPRYDIRIFRKECVSLSNNYDVSLLISDGKGDEVVSNVKILDLGINQKSRLKRFLGNKSDVFRKALSLDCAIYHIHDPELIPVGLKLIRNGKKVIYDAHEDVPRQILTKEYIPYFIRKTVGRIFEIYENRAVKKFSHIIAATPFIKERFKTINPFTTDVNNFPIIEEFSTDTDWHSRKNEICYIGSITKARGIIELINAIDKTEIKLNLAGTFDDQILENDIKGYSGWKNVTGYGFVNRTEIATILNRSKIGIVTLHPKSNYLDSLPIKMFEYMAAGLAVIASDFPLWKRIIESHKCGICVDPLNPQDIKNAIEYLTAHQDEAENMGKNGRIAVKDIYNWRIENIKLQEVYVKLLSMPALQK